MNSGCDNGDKPAPSRCSAGRRRDDPVGPLFRVETRSRSDRSSCSARSSACTLPDYLYVIISSASLLAMCSCTTAVAAKRSRGRLRLA